MISMSSLKRKKYQRAVNRFIRELNKAIENDELWKGRFYAHQIQSSFYIYSDRSGAVLYYRLRFVDKEKKKYFDVPGWFDTHLFYRSKICEALNEYIIHLSGVWDENPTRDTTTNWCGRHVRMEELSPYTDGDFERMSKRFW